MEVLTNLFFSKRNLTLFVSIDFCTNPRHDWQCFNVAKGPQGVGEGVAHGMAAAETKPSIIAVDRKPERVEAAPVPVLGARLRRQQQYMQVQYTQHFEELAKLFSGISELSSFNSEDLQLRCLKMKLQSNNSNNPAPSGEIISNASLDSKQVERKQKTERK